MAVRMRELSLALALVLLASQAWSASRGIEVTLREIERAPRCRRLCGSMAAPTPW